MKPNNQMQPLNFIFIGRSGSGKGSQSKFVMKKFPNIVYISTGDLFRELAKHDTDTALRIQEDLEIGALPFDDLATTLWMHKIANTVKRDEGILLDGAPRRVQEAKNLERFIKFLHRTDNTFVIFLDITREEAIRRLLKRGRSDDNDKAIMGRMDYYEEYVAPTVEFYKEQNRLISIDGNQPKEKVFADIIAQLPSTK